MSTPISVRFDEELNTIFTQYVTENHIKKADFIRQAVAEKLEDLYDIELADKAYQEWVDGGKKTYSHEEMMKRYG